MAVQKICTSPYCGLSNLYNSWVPNMTLKYSLIPCVTSTIASLKNKNNNYSDNLKENTSNPKDSLLVYEFWENKKKMNILIYIAGFCRFCAHIIIQYVIHRHLTWQRNYLEWYQIFYKSQTSIKLVCGIY